MKIEKALEILEGIALEDKITPEIDEAITLVIDKLIGYHFRNKVVPAPRRGTARLAEAIQARAIPTEATLEQAIPTVFAVMPSQAEIRGTTGTAASYMMGEDGYMRPAPEPSNEGAQW